MDRTPVRDVAVVEPPPQPADRAAPPSHRRWVLGAAVVLVALQVGVRGRLVAGRSFHADDYRLQYLADTHGLFSPSFLLYDYDGHLMPGALLLAGLVERVAPLEWWAAATSLVVLQLLASLALLRLLRLLLGDRPLLLVPLAFGLFTPITLGYLTWWAAALNSLPLQIGTAWFLSEAVLLARTGSRRYAVRGTGVLALTFLFYLKTVLVPGVAFAVVALVLLRDGEHRPLVAAWRRGRALWLGSLAVLGVWAAVYLSTRTDAPASGGSTENLVATVRTGFRVLAASVLGGPFEWTSEPPFEPYAAVASWTAVTGALILLVAVVWSCLRRRGAVALWALVLGEAAAGLVLAGAGRGGLAAGETLPLACRYFAVEAVLLPVAAALLATLPVRRSAGGTGRRRQWAALPLGAATVAFVVAALLSTADAGRAWEQHRSGAYLAAARESLGSAGPTPMLDQQLPSDVMWPLAFPSNLVSRALAPLDDRPPVERWTTELRVLDDRGRLQDGEVDPVSTLAEGPVPGCGWPVATGGTAVALTPPVFPWEWTVRLDYVADRDGRIVVDMVGGDPVRAPVRAGDNSIFLRMDGGGPTMDVAVETPGLVLCVGGGAVGNVVLR